MQNEPLRGTDWAIDTLVLTILWFMASVFTLGFGLGAATGAVYKQQFRMIRYRDRPRDLFGEFRSDFKSTLPYSIVHTVVLAVLVAGLSFAFLAADDLVLRIVLAVAGFEAALSFIYGFPMLAVFKFESYGHFLKTATLVSNYHALTTFQALLLLLATVVISVILPWIWLFVLVAYFIFSAKVLHRTLFPYIRRIEKADAQDAAKEGRSDADTLPGEQDVPFEDESRENDHT